MTGIIASPVCQGSASTITLSSTAAGMPAGNYTVTYNTSAPNFSTGNTVLMVVSTPGTGSFSTGNLTSFGSTQITVTDLSLGTCTNAVVANNTTNITVNQIPAIPAVAGGGTFCGNATLIASGGVPGTIYFQGTVSGGTQTVLGGSTQNITSSGTYYFRSLNAGCWGPEGSVNVFINPLPTATLTYTSPLCKGVSPLTSPVLTALTGGPLTPTGYSASPAGLAINTSTGQIDPATSTPGTYTVTANFTGNNGCPNTATTTVEIRDPLTGLSYLSTTAVYCAGAAITNNTSSISGTGPYSYSVLPALPAGLTLNASNGTISGTPAAGAPAANYTITASNGCSSTQAIINITVNPALTGNTISTPSQAICSGSSLTTAASTPTDGTGVYTYLWESSTTGAGGPYAAAAGTNNAQGYTTGPLTVPTWFRRIVYSGNCSANVSDFIAITIDATTNGGTISNAVNTVCSGINTTILTLSGQVGTIQRWEYSLDNFATAGISLGTSVNPVTINNRTQTTWYRAVVKNGTCLETNSNTAVINVSAPSVGGSVAGAATVCSGSNSGNLTLSGETGAVQRWEFSVNSGGLWTPISNLTNTQSYSNLTQTTWYRAVVKNSVCSEIASAIVVITVSPTSVGGSISPASSDVCTGGDVLLTLTGETGSRLWQSSTDNFATVINNLGTAATQTISNVTVVTQVRVVVTSSPCAATYSNVIVLTPRPIIGNNTISSAQNICYNTAPAMFTGSNPTGGTGVYTYLWESSTVSATGPFTAAAGTNNTASYTSPVLLQQTWFRRRVQSGGCTDYSGSVVVTIKKINNNTIPASGSAVCPNTNLGTYVGSLPTGGNGIFTYLWEISIVGPTTSFAAAAGVNNAKDYLVGIQPQTCWLRRIVFSDGCSDTSAVTGITIITTPGSITPVQSVICEGGIVKLDAFGSASYASGTFGGNGIWESNTNGGTSFSQLTPGNNGNWSRENNGITVFGNTFTSNDASDFVMTRNQNVTVLNNVILRQESSTDVTSLPNLFLRFYHSYRALAATDSAMVDVSGNGGVTWTTVKKFTSTQGASNNFAFESVDVTPYKTNNFRVQFRFHGSQNTWWAVDNLTLTGQTVAAQVYIWAPTTGLYLDNGATVAYTGTAVSTVYAKPTATTTYSIQASSGSCFTAQGATVIVNRLPTLSSLSQAAVCEGSTGTIQLNGLLPNKDHTISYTINGVGQTNATLTASAGGIGTFVTPILTTTNNGQALVITSMSTANGANPSCSKVFTNSISLAVNAKPVLGTVTQLAPVCAGSGAVISLTGLLAGSNNSIRYTIAAGAPINISG
ncbi:MAG: hypothetical protein EOP51_18360, partial [Sphingobacteriales bacterium]